MGDLNGIEYPFIAGRRDTSRSTETFDSVNPATEEVIAQVVQCDQGHVDDAVAAARAAQRAWWKLSPATRGEHLWRWGDLLVEHSEELAKLDTMDMGKPIGDALASTPVTSKLCRYYAGLSDKIWGDMTPVTPGHLSYTVREPLGVSGVILPWNGPIQAFVGRVAAALSFGNAVVVKPSEFSPLSALRLAELTLAAGMPAGLVNVLTGDGRVGAMLASHPGVDGVSFTGSVPTGRKVNEAAASTFKKVVLEMGGKSPNIVFADANMDEAVRGTLWGVFYNTGQVCCAGTRLVVERSVADEFVARLKDQALRMRVGDPMDPAVHIGPIVCKKQYERVQSYLEIGRSEAHVELGGGRPSSVPGDVGFYVEPTIFTEATPAMRISQEEIFGPVLTVLTFDDDEEALALANDVEYGLAAIIWTRDSGRLLRMAERVEAGTVWCNTARLYNPALPFGGYKNSGLGNASGDGAIEGNTKLKRVSIRFDDNAPAPGWNL
jgi:acyl-CoA reductase-like NAD-dependent aldehyde dehydrogenase